MEPPASPGKSVQDLVQDVEAIREFSKCLDPKFKSIKNWEDFACLLGVSTDIRKKCKLYDQHSPTVTLFINLKITRPNMTIDELKDVLTRSKTRARPDIKKMIDSDLEQNYQKEHIGNLKVVDVITNSTSDLLDRIAIKLDSATRPVCNWLDFGLELGIDRHILRRFEMYVSHNPTEKLFRCVYSSSKKSLKLSTLLGFLDGMERHDILNLEEVKAHSEQDTSTIDTKDVFKLGSKLLDETSQLLNRDVKGAHGWRRLAELFEENNYIDIPDIISNLELPKQHEIHSPTTKTIQWLAANKPELTIGNLIEACENISRRDAVNVLRKHFPTFSRSIPEERIESTFLQLHDSIQGSPEQTDAGNHNVVRRKRKYGLKNKRSSFLGRDTMLNDIYNYFTCENKRMVVVLGPPGFGKSEVLIHAGHRLNEDGSFSVIFVYMLHTITMDDLCGKILTAVGRDFKLSDNVVEQAEKFLVSLQTPTVLILDNCEDMQNSPSKRAFQEFIEYVGRDATMLKLLLGTRNEITTYEFKSQTVQIKPLELDYSFELLKKHTPDIDDADAKLLAEACNGVPLLILIAGIRVQHGYNPKKLAEHLRANSYDVWRVDECVSDSIRVFLNSFNRNKVDLRCDLVVLANFPSCFTLEEAKELYIDSEFRNSCDCSNMFNLLCKNALLQLDDGQYSIHPLIQTFCRKEQEQIGCAEVGQKAKHDFCVHYFNKLEMFHGKFQGQGFTDALKAYRDIYMNIEQAKQHALSSENKEIKVRCLDAFNNSVNFLVQVMNPKQCHLVYKELLGEAKDINDPKQIAKCNVSIGFRHLLDCNHLKFSQDAFDSLLCAHEHFKRLPKKEQETEAFAHCLSKLGLCYCLNNNGKKGKKLMRQAARIRCALGDPLLIAAGDCDQAIASMKDEDFPKAITLLENCYCAQKSKQLKDHPWAATIRMYMSKCNRHLGKLDEAVEDIKQSLDIRINVLGDHQNTARTHVFLAELLEEKGELESALNNCNKAISILNKVETDKENIRSLKVTMGRIQDRMKEAKRCSYYESSV